MKELIEKFTSQIEVGQGIAESFALSIKGKTFKNVLITGLGGSGIGGSIVAELAAKHASIPVVLNKDYFIPEFVNNETLVIVSSYSGNTEETLQAALFAKERGATLVAITSGGKLQEWATTNNIDTYILPGGMSPRACLAYSLTVLIFIFKDLGLLPASAKNEVENAVKLLNQSVEEIKERAKKVAGTLQGKTPVIYTVAGYEGIAIRMRQQINENSKVLCWHQVIPEMNHNELVGWTEKNENLCVLFLRNDNDYDRTQLRIELCKEIISKYTPHIFELYSKGQSAIERMFYFILLGDWISWYLSDLRKVDAVEVKVIDFLKGELAKS